MHKFFYWLTLAILASLLVGGRCHAQSTIPVSGQKVVDQNLKPLTGQLLFTVTDSTDTPITYTPQGGSATTATFTVPVIKGAVQYVGGFPAQIANLATMTPANSFYRMQVQTTGGATTIYTFPLTTTPPLSFSYDGYAVPAGVTSSGIGLPKIPCNPHAMYNNTSASDPYPWVCSQNPNSNAVYWTQNPSLNPTCQRGNDQAIASTPLTGQVFCVDSTQAFVTPGFIWAGPPSGDNPQQIGLVPVSTICSTGGCGGGAPAGIQFRLSAYLATPSAGLATLTNLLFGTDATGADLLGVRNVTTTSVAAVNSTTSNVLTGHITNGILNTDTASGLINAIAGCTGSSPCALSIPPTSTDTTIGAPTAAPSASQSSFFVDNRGNSTGLYGVNPGVTNNASNGPGGAVGPGAQILSHDGVNFTLPNPSLGPSNPNSSQGDPQIYHTEFHNFFAAGIDNGNSGCPLFCAQPQFQAGAADWSQGIGNYRVLNFFGSGITAGDTDVMRKFGIGDHQHHYWYTLFGGGFAVPSDEGDYPGGAWQAFSLGNYICTISSKVDNYHIFCPTIGVGSQATGGGRYIMNTAHPVASDIQIGAFNPPSGSTYGTITFPNSTIPTGVAAGIVTNGCNVPVQDEGVAVGTDNSTGTSGCIITVTSGAFEATAAHGNVADGAYPQGNLHNVSMEVTNATALSSGHQTLTMTLKRSLPQGAFIFQGGVAGALVCLNQDDTNLGDQNGQTVFGSCYPLVGTLDPHTAVYAAYNSSQIWTALPLPASQAISMATDGIGFGGFNLKNLSRDSAGNVTGTFDSGNTFNRQFIMNGARFFTITNSAGCTNGLFDSPAASNSVAASLAGSDPTAQTLVMPTPVTGAPGTCASAKVFGQGVLADIYWSAEVTDVVNHTNPKAGADGTIAATYMPPAHFPTGDELQSPPHYALGITGEFKVMNMATPALKSDGIEVLMNNYSAFGSNAITLVNNPIVQLQFGYQGAASPSTALNILGQFGDTINLVVAPPVNSAVVRIGFPSPNCGGTNNCNLLQNYDFLNIQAGAYREHWDAFTNTMGYFNGAGQLPTFAISPGSVTSNGSDIMANAQFEAINDAGATVPLTQFHISAPFGRYSPASAVPASYDAIILPPVLSTTTVPAGSSTNVYFFVAHLPGGDTIGQPVQLFNQNTVPVTTGANTLSCSTVPVGATADLWMFLNPGFQQVTGQTCNGPTGTVVDNGSAYGANTATINAHSAGGTLNAGSFTAQGLRGFFGWTQADIFGITTPATTITLSMNQTAAGVLRLNAGLPGSALAEFDAGAIKSNNSPVCTVAAPCASTSGVASIDTLTGAFTFSGPGVSHVGNVYTFSGTGTGVGSVGLTAPSWLAVGGSPVTSSGVLALTAATGQTSHQVIGTCGTATSFGPCSLVAGDIPALAYLPTSTTLATTKAATTHQWLNSYTSSTGVFTATQPAFTDISGNLGTTQGPILTGLLKDAAGTLSVATAGTDYLAPTGSSAGLSQGSSSAFGVFKCDGTTVTCASGILSAVGGGGSGISAISIASANGISGTSSGGTTPILTLALGAITPTSISIPGSTQGYSLFGVGTGTITLPVGAPTNYVGIIGPASGTPAYLLALPTVAPTAGQFMAFAAPTTINGLNQAAGTWATPGLTSNPLSQFAATTSAQLRSILSDESGTGAALFAGGALGAATATSINGTTIPSSVTLTQTVANGNTALGTAAIASGACATVVTATATGTATTDVVSWSFNGDVTAIIGYAPVTTGGLSLYVYPTANTFNVKACNSSSASITPGAVTLNWRVMR